MTPRKAIHFSAQEYRIHEIPTLDDLSDEEYGSCYYSPAEYLWMNKRERKLLKRLKMVGDVGPDDDALGLVSKSQNQERHLFMDLAHNAVFSEQQRQIEEATYISDPDVIASLYAKITEEPAHRANLRAEGLYTQLTTAHAHMGSRRWSMDMGMGRRQSMAPKRPPPTPSLSDNFDFSETQPPSPLSPRRALHKNKIAMPVQALQSPNQNRWKGASANGVSNMNSSASLGLPRRMRTPQCQLRKTLGFEVASPLATPVL